MMLFIPTSVTDAIEPIRDFVDNGMRSSRSKADDSIKVSQFSGTLSHHQQEVAQQTKSILDACEDAVIVCNQSRYRIKIRIG